LNGAPINAENNTAMPPAFLMQQMEWREALDDATAVAELEALETEVRQAREAALQRIEALIDTEHDFKAAAQQVRTLMFIERFKSDIAERIDAEAEAGQ
jgi:molecular chaperone HscB